MLVFLKETNSCTYASFCLWLFLCVSIDSRSCVCVCVFLESKWLKMGWFSSLLFENVQYFLTLFFFFFFFLCLWKCEYESNGCWKLIKISTMEYQIGPCTNFVLLQQQACNSANNWGQICQLELIADVGRLSSLTSSILKKIVENFIIKKHTHNPYCHHQQIRFYQPHRAPPPTPGRRPSLQQKVSKACRIEGSKSSSFLFYFLPLRV
jgi:hypothetical protein